MPRRPGPPDIPRLEPTDLKDTRWQRQRGLKPPLQTGIYRQLVEEGYEEQTSSPANDRYRDIMARQQERLDGHVSPRQKQLGDPMEAVGAVLEEGRRLGADIVGVCQVMPEHVFQGHETEVHPNAIVLAMAMDHEYGNGTAIFTRDGDTARDFASRINIGMVGINVPIPVPLAYHTFGGWKKSAFGDLNQHGPDAFKFFTRTKTVTSRWPSGLKEGGEFHFKAMD